MTDHQPHASGSGSGSGSSNLPNLAPVRANNGGDGLDTGNGNIGVDVGELASRPFTDAQVDEFREQDRWLPIANVARIMKSALPTSAKVSKEAKECVQECVSEFISFITSEGADKCINEKRKTLNGEDILTSMRALGFDNYEGVLRVYLAKYRDAHHAIPKRSHAQEDDSDDLSAPTSAVPERKKRGRGRVSAAVTATNSRNVSGSNTPLIGTADGAPKGKKKKVAGDGIGI